MKYDPNNVFARILRGEMPAYTLYEDEYSMAFMDVMPQADGHALVIPKDPTPDLFAADPVILGKTMQTTQRIAKAVQVAFQADGIMIAQLNGSAAGQTVFHLHFHIIPRSAGADFRLHAREMADPALLALHAQKIKSALNSG